MNVRNWEHNSGKKHKGRGISKGKLKARKQTLKALKDRYMGGSKKPPVSVMITL